MNKVEKIKPKITTITKVIRKTVYTDLDGSTYETIGSLRIGIMSKLYKGKFKDEFGEYRANWNLFRIYNVEQMNNWNRYFNTKVKVAGVYQIYRSEYNGSYKAALVFDLRDIS